MKLYLFLITMLASLQFASARQQKTACIYKVTAFSEKRFLGNIPVDEKGNPIGQSSYIIYTLYIETTGKAALTVQKLTKGKEELTVEAVEEVPGQTINAGKQKQDSKSVILKTSGKNKLWKIESGQANFTASDNSTLSSPIVIKGICSNKQFTLSVTQVIPLESVPAQ